MLRAVRDYHISMQNMLRTGKRLSHKHANMLRAVRDYHISMQTC